MEKKLKRKPLSSQVSVKTVLCKRCVGRISAESTGMLTVAQWQNGRILSSEKPAGLECDYGKELILVKPGFHYLS